MSFMKFIKSFLEHKPSHGLPATSLKPDLPPNKLVLETNIDIGIASPAAELASAALQAASQITAIKPHVPLIKFRKGLSPSTRTQDAETAQPRSGGSGRSAGSLLRATIEDYQLPAKYRRQQLDDKEIEYINRGGPE